MKQLEKKPTLQDCEKEILRLKSAQNVRGSGWSVSEICLHCAQTIDYSMTGYPKMKPAILRATIGKLVIKKFLRQGYMKHDLAAHVPGGAPLDASRSADESLEELLAAIHRFHAYQGELKPHLIFGKLSRQDYDSYFAMHIAEHLGQLQYRAA